MADLADQIDDYICSFEGVGDLTMDTLAMLIFAWAVVGLFLLWLCKYLYKKYVKKGDTSTDATGSKLPVGSDTDKLRKSEPKDILASKEVKVSSLFFFFLLFIKYLFIRVKKKKVKINNVLHT